jgi:hypothetical protein
MSRQSLIARSAGRASHTGALHLQPSRKGRPFFSEIHSTSRASIYVFYSFTHLLGPSAPGLTMLFAVMAQMAALAKCCEIIQPDTPRLTDMDMCYRQHNSAARLWVWLVVSCIAPFTPIFCTDKSDKPADFVPVPWVCRIINWHLFPEHLDVLGRHHLYVFGASKPWEGVFAAATLPCLARISSARFRISSPAPIGPSRLAFVASRMRFPSCFCSSRSF